MFMAEAVSAFLRRNPRVDIRFVNDNWVGLVAALRRRELDFVVAAQPAPEEAADLVIQPLSSRQAYFLVRPGHPLLAKPELSLADIVAYPIICSAASRRRSRSRCSTRGGTAKATGTCPKSAASPTR